MKNMTSKHIPPKASQHGVMDRLIHGIDLNLLRALHVLLEERSVTKAAERLFITQSAMSKSLWRLREALSDPLFTRFGQGLVPTSRAQDLAIPLRQIFQQMSEMLVPAQFDPLTTRDHVRIAAPEHIALAIVPALISRCAHAAPGLQVECVPLMDDHLQKLAMGIVDFAIDFERSRPESVNVRSLYKAPPVFLCRKHHPLATGRLVDIEATCSFPQITCRSLNLSQDSLAIVDELFNTLSLTRQTILDTNHLLLAIDVLLGSDALMLAPEYLLRLDTTGDKVTALPIAHSPLYDELQVHFQLLHHARTLASPLHRWISDQIDDIADTFPNSGNRQATIDVERLAGDVARRLRTQK